MKLPSALILPVLFSAVLLSSCATAPRVDPVAQALLTQTTEKLRNARTIEITGHRQADAALLRAGSDRESVNFQLAVSRPDSIAARSFHPHGTRHLLAGSGGLTMYDEGANAYITLRTNAQSIDELVAAVEDQLDVKLTVGEMLGADPMATLMEDVNEVRVGGDEKIGGAICTRLDFLQRDLAWSLWISRSDALPRRSALTYLKLPGRPQRIVTIHQWKLNQPIPNSVFSLSMKKGAHAVEVIR